MSLRLLLLCPLRPLRADSVISLVVHNHWHRISRVQQSDLGHEMWRSFPILSLLLAGFLLAVAGTFNASAPVLSLSRSSDV